MTKGVLVYLRISGIGYRATIEGQTITFKLGFSHDIAYDLPDSMRAFLPEPTLIGLYGIDKNQVPNSPLLSLQHQHHHVQSVIKESSCMHVNFIARCCDIGKRGVHSSPLQAPCRILFVSLRTIAAMGQDKCADKLQVMSEANKVAMYSTV